MQRMKKLILSILAVFVGLMVSGAPARSQDLSETAKEFFQSKGITLYDLKCTRSTENLAVYSDSYAKCFVVLAANKFKAKLGGDQVLAYSTESALNGGVDDMVYEIVGRYDAQLKKIKPSRCFFRSRLLSRRERQSVYIAPMAMNIGQGAPYNKYFPIEDGQRLVSGCGPLAVAQILYANKFPASPQGQGSITDTKGRVTNYNLGSFTFKFDGSEDDIARVLLASSAALNGKATLTGETQSAFNDMKSVLVSKFGYSPACTHYKGGDNLEFVNALKDELRSRRPVLVAQSSVHTFICDGLDGTFVHLNFGWTGYCNGWYRLMLFDSDTQRLPFNEMMVGLVPFTDEDMSTLSVTTTEAGTLESLLTEEQIKTAYSIKVSGPINGTDIVVLRRMAGANVEGRNGHGILSEMDLSDATIVGNEPYHTRPCYNMGVSGYYPDGTAYSYDMSKITDAEWAKFTANHKEKNSSRLITKGDDGVYYITFFSENNILGKYMFENCENLITVSLPTNLVEMRSNIFLNCRALKTVNNMPEKCDPNALKGSGLANN
jgi:hypothetical protein